MIDQNRPASYRVDYPNGTSRILYTPRHLFFEVALFRAKDEGTITGWKMLPGDPEQDGGEWALPQESLRLKGESAEEDDIEYRRRWN